MEVLGRLLALLVLLLLGTGLRTTGVLNTQRTARLNAAAYYVALPALIFVSTYDQAIGDLLSLELLGGLLFVLFSTAGIAGWFTAVGPRRRDGASRLSSRIIRISAISDCHWSRRRSART